MDTPPGWMIEEWNLFMTAKQYGVAAWELAKQPAWWLNRMMFYADLERGVKTVKVEKR